MAKHPNDSADVAGITFTADTEREHGRLTKRVPRPTKRQEEAGEEREIADELFIPIPLDFLEVTEDTLFKDIFEITNAKNISQKDKITLIINAIGRLFELNSWMESEEEALRSSMYSLMGAIFAIITKSESMREHFKAHPIGRFLQGHLNADPVAQEIALEVSTFWEERKYERIASQPWAQNPALFVKHVYAKWLSANTLRRAHLAHDERLYHAYKQHVKRHPEDDLGLPSEPRRRISDPAETLRVRRAENAKKSAARRASRLRPS
jgi:hypothetical protein